MKKEEKRKEGRENMGITIQNPPQKREENICMCGCKTTHMFKGLMLISKISHILGQEVKPKTQWIWVLSSRGFKPNVHNGILVNVY